MLKPEIAALYASHAARRVTYSEIPEYRVWIGMIARCGNPKNRGFHRYGGRGISVCPIWRASLWVFLNDMGRRPADDLEIDRIDNDGNYEPGNCRWATRTEQMNNRSLIPAYKGDQNHFAKLTWPVVNEIRSRHAKGTSQAALGRKYGVHRATVGYIVRNETWCID